MATLFTIGRPVVSRSLFDGAGDSEKEVDVVVSANRANPPLVAVAKGRSISFLCGNFDVAPYLKLGDCSILLGEDEEDAHGHIVEVVWKPDSSSIAARMSSGWIHLLRIDLLNSEFFPENGDFSDLGVVSVAKGIHGISVRQSTPPVLLSGGGSIAMTTDRTRLFALTADFHLCSVMWSGEVDASCFVPEFPGSKLFSKESSPEMMKKGSFLTYSRLLDACVVCWNGSAIVLVRTGERNPFDPFGGFEARDLDSGSESITAVDICPSRRLIMVGCDSGAIIQFFLGEKSLAPAVCSSHRRITLDDLSPSLTSPLGCVTHIVCCPEGGGSFAAAWEGGMCGLFAGNGGMSSRLLLESSTRTNVEDSEEAESNGLVRSICFGSSGLSLICAMQNDYVVCYALARDAGDVLGRTNGTAHEPVGLACYSIESFVCCGSLLTSNGLLLCGLSGFQRSPSCLQVLVPNSYLLGNWPMKYVATGISEVACAGRRGVVVYSLATRTWRQFLDQAAEETIAVRSLSWMSPRLCQTPVLLVGSYNMKAITHEIIFFTPTKSSVASARLCRLLVDSRPLAVCTTEQGFLLVHLAPAGTISIYALPEGSLETELRRNSPSLVKTVTFHGLFRAPALAISPLEESIPDVLLTAMDGTVAWCNVLEEEKVDIAVDVERIWVPPHVVAKSLNIVFAGYSSTQGLLFWDHSGSSGPFVETSSVFSRLLVPRESSPLCVDWTSGALCCTNQGVLRAHTDDALTFFEPIVEARPFLQIIIAMHLKKGRKEVGALVHLYKQEPFCAHACELLLRDLLDRLSDKESGASESLRTVCGALADEGVLSAVAVAAGRRSEQDVWHDLFSFAGSPSSLCKEIITTGGDLRAAAAALLLVHEVDGSSEAHKCCAFLVESAFDRGEYEILAPILRFLDGGGSDGLDGELFPPNGIHPAVIEVLSKFMSSLASGRHFFSLWKCTKYCHLDLFVCLKRFGRPSSETDRPISGMAALLRFFAKDLKIPAFRPQSDLPEPSMASVSAEALDVVRNVFVRLGDMDNSWFFDAVACSILIGDNPGSIASLCAKGDLWSSLEALRAHDCRGVRNLVEAVLCERDR